MLHFITGLPRSGTTLLGAILRQNPRFSGGMSTPLSGIVDRSLVAMSPTANEFAIGVTEQQRRNILSAILDAWVKDFTPSEVVFDTSRSWAARLPLISRLRPDAKVIACVRNPAWVFDSIERLLRANAMNVSRLIANDAERATVYARAEALGRPDRLIGYSINALKEAYYSEHSDRLLILEYDLLAARPEDAMKLVYDFLGEDWFAHDFDNVDYAAEEFDAKLDTPGLHDVKRKVEFTPRQTILPPDIFEKYASQMFWRDLKGTRAKAIVVNPKAEAEAAAEKRH